MSKSIVSIVKNNTTPDAVEIDAMMRESFELLGGLKKYVHDGDLVVIKGNFFAPYPPPVIVDRRTAAALIRQLYEAGAGKVVLCEAVSVGTKLGRGTDTQYVLDEMGIREAAEKEGAEILCLEDAERLNITVPDGKCIGMVEYPQILLDADVLIDLPCMKTHGMTLVTLGLKNFQGILSDRQKYYAHRDDLEQKIVDVFRIRKPDLTIIDGITAMEGNGAGEAGIPHPMNMFIASTDVVAADCVATACMGIDPMDVQMNRIADYEGIGNGQMDQIEVVGKQIDEVAEKFVLPDMFQHPQDRNVTARYKNIDCRAGGACVRCYDMAAGVSRMLSSIKEENFMLLIGCDPNVPNGASVKLDNVIMLGDCACSAGGAVKLLRNQMLLEGKGILAPGCPPYRPATAIIEKELKKRNLLDIEGKKKKSEMVTKKAYEYYKSVDPTWKPASER